MKSLWIPLKSLYGLAVSQRNSFFDRGWLNVYKSPIPVVSVGNLTTGGTGKTPWVCFLAEKLAAEGYSVGVVSRGYGRSSKGLVEVFPEDMTAEECGDEPLLIAQKMKIPVFVCEQRKKAIEALLAKHNVDVLLMDDGFQHRYVHRDINIVLFDASAPISHYQLLPEGRLREPLSSLQRADFVIFNKWNLATVMEQKSLEKKLCEYMSPQLLVGSSYVFSEPKPLFSAAQKPFAKENYLLACGIARPETFLKSAEKALGSPRATFYRPDHCKWTSSDLESLRSIAQAHKICDILVTEKDGVKLKAFAEESLAQGFRFWSLPLKVKVVDISNEEPTKNLPEPLFLKNFMAKLKKCSR